MKKQKFVLIVGEETGTLVHFVEGKAYQVWSLASPHHLQAVLQSYPRVTLEVLINTLEQDINYETLPKLNAFYKHQYVRRCLELKYDKAGFLGVNWQGERQETLMIAAIHQSEHLHA